MVAPSVLPGRAFQRIDRVSRLFFHWRANDLSLTPVTGETPTFARTSAGGAVRDRYGILRMPVHSQPRFDLFDDDADSVWETPRLLTEIGRTNLLVRSEEFDNVAWVKTNTTVTANGLSAPDGTVTADKLVETAITDVHEVAQIATITAGNDIAFSVFARQAERSKIAIYVRNGVDFVEFKFNLVTGALISTSAAGAAILRRTIIEPATPSDGGTRFYRITLVARVNGVSTAIDCLTRLLDNAGNISYAGDTSNGLYLWGAQAEEGAFSTSYIKTTSATVARSPERLDYPFLVKPQPSLWLYLDFIERGGAYLAAGAARLFGTDVGTDAIRMMFYNPTVNRWNFVYSDGPAFSAAGMSEDAPLGARIQLLGLIGTNGAASLRWAINGAADQVVGPGVAATFPSAFTTPNLGLGNGPTGTNGAPAAMAVAKVGVGAAVNTIAKAAAAF